MPELLACIVGTLFSTNNDRVCLGGVIREVLGFWVLRIRPVDWMSHAAVNSLLVCLLLRSKAKLQMPLTRRGHSILRRCQPRLHMAGNTVRAIISRRTEQAALCRRFSVEIGVPNVLSACGSALDDDVIHMLQHRCFFPILACSIAVVEVRVACASSLDYSATRSALTTEQLWLSASVTEQRGM